MKYGKFNWLRLWFLGEKPRVVDEALFSTSSLTKYLTFMSTVLSRLVNVVGEDGRLCLVIGDVTGGGRTIRLADHVAETCVPNAMETIDIIVDELPVDRKVSRIWGETKGMATRTDRILVLGRRGSGGLPPLPYISWEKSGPRASGVLDPA